MSYGNAGDAAEADPTLTAAELEEWLTYAFRDITEAEHERRHGDHDRNGFLCDYALSEKCLALGHALPDGVDEDDADDEAPDWADEHPYGWTGDRVCKGTIYAQACSSCEGECHWAGWGVDLWALPGVGGPRG